MQTLSQHQDELIKPILNQEQSALKVMGGLSTEKKEVGKKLEKIEKTHDVAKELETSETPTSSKNENQKLLNDLVDSETKEFE